jgi:hypothetical protein
MAAMVLCFSPVEKARKVLENALLSGAGGQTPRNNTVAVDSRLLRRLKGVLDTFSLHFQRI